MAGPFFSCNVNTLIQNAKCFLDFCCGEDDRQALDLYFRVENLKALGGTDYTGLAGVATLTDDARSFYPLACHQREAISLYIDEQNAIDNGSGLDTDINVIKNNPVFKQALAMGVEQRKNILLYLKCQINTLGSPD